MASNVLMIVTSINKMGETDKPTGFWAEELAVPYYALKDAGVTVEIATTAGGAAPVDPGSMKPPGQNDAIVERFLADTNLQGLLAPTPKVAELHHAKYDAIFLPGGHGTMWDLPNDAGVKAAVETTFAAGKLIASVCHGAAGLLSARRADGKAAIEGYRINGFTNTEEDAVGLTSTVPFALETRIRELGATFEGVSNWQPFAIRDRQFITGQNPQSSKLVAEQLLAALGVAQVKNAA